MQLSGLFIQKYLKHLLNQLGIGFLILILNTFKLNEVDLMACEEC